MRCLLFCCGLLYLEVGINPSLKFSRHNQSSAPLQGVLICPRCLGCPSCGANFNKRFNCVKVIVFGAIIFVMPGGEQMIVPCDSLIYVNENRTFRSMLTNTQMFTVPHVTSTSLQCLCISHSNKGTSKYLFLLELGSRFLSRFKHNNHF